MSRLLGLILLAVVMAMQSFPAAAQSDGRKIQLRLSNAMTEQVDYYVVVDGKPKPVGSVRARSVIDVDAFAQQDWIFGIKGKPFQRYKVRAELFQNLTIAPEGQRKNPVVANAYQPAPGSKPTNQAGANAATQKTTTQKTAKQPEPDVNASAPVVTDNGMVWSQSRYQDGEDQNLPVARLVYSVPETDNIQFIATCTARENDPKVILLADVSRLKANSRAKVRFVGQDFDETYTGLILHDPDGNGQDGAVIDIPTDDPFWTALPALAAFRYSIGGLRTMTLPLKGSSKPAKTFLRGCQEFGGAMNSTSAKAQPIIVNPPSNNALGNDSCSAASNARSTDGGTVVNLTVVNRTGEFRNIDWIDFSGRSVSYAGLNDGQSFALQTSTSHPWMATDGPGNCIEIFKASQNNPVIELTKKSPGFGAEND